MSATDLYESLLNKSSDMQGHLATLYGWVVRLRPEWVIELGVREGVSTTALLAGLEHNGEGTLWSCDTSEPPAEISEHPQWQFAQGDDRSPEDLDPPPPGSCQILFIDTSHTGVHTRRELAIYGERVDPGGVVLAHDVDLPSCGRQVREWSRRKKANYCFGLSATLMKAV